MVYVFYWNDCTFESAAAAMSFHYTAAGAYAAMRKHLLSEYSDWEDMSRQFRSQFKFGFGKDWFIAKQEVHP